jgi:lipoprotein-anchoring transpeptidase ErfK/SrfK
MEDFDEEAWRTLIAEEEAAAAAAAEDARVLALVNSQYIGDYTLEWAEAHDYTAAEKERWVNLNGYDSATDWLLWVSITHQRVNIFSGAKGSWALQRSCIVGTGAPGHDTPRGIWYVTYKLADGWTTYSYTVAPVVDFIGALYAFHSRLYYPGTRALLDPGIGYPISHGCIRMYDEDINWIFETIPIRSTVLVY